MPLDSVADYRVYHKNIASFIKEEYEIMERAFKYMKSAPAAGGRQLKIGEVARLTTANRFQGVRVYV